MTVRDGLPANLGVTGTNMDNSTTFKSIPSPTNSQDGGRMENDKNNPKKRIRVACDTCRRKKIRCDGSYPCGNCTQSSNEANCVYKERPVKKKIKAPPKQPVEKVKKIPKRVSNRKTIEILDTRLSSLENVILKLTDKLDQFSPPQSKSMRHFKISNSQNAKTINRKKSSSAYVTASLDSETDADTFYKIREGDGDDDEDDNDNDNEDDNEDDDEDDDLTASDSNSDESSTEGSDNNESSKKEEQLHANDPRKPNKGILQTLKIEQYFGTHSIMCIFSQKSLEWIEGHLGPEAADVITPITNLPSVFYSKLKSFTLKWIDPPIIDAKGRRKLLERPLPDNRALVFDLLDTYYKDLTMVNSLCKEDYLRDLLTVYYDNFNQPNVTKRRKFKLSEYLIMSLGVLSCITAKIDEDSVSEVSTPVSAMSVGLLDNAIFYYHRISVISEGLETVQGILLLVTYIESNWLTSHVNYILTSVAIRFAQELGLHRSETYDGLPIEEQERRRVVWLYCHYFDMEICFRSGKPPMINDADVTTNSDEDLEKFWTLSYDKCKNTGGIVDFPELNANLPTLPQYLRLMRTETHPAFFYFYLLMITKVKVKSYNKLFVANARTENSGELYKTLDSLNQDMLQISDHVSDHAKPRFYNDPKFNLTSENISRTERESILGLQLTYFLHLMIMNRVPSMLPACSNDAQANKFRNLSLDSARTILILIRQIDKKHTSVSYYNWFLFFPVAAFLTLSAAILNHPNIVETNGDLKLLIDCSINFFGDGKPNSIFEEDNSNLNVYSSKEVLVGLIVKLMLRIVLKFYESKTNISLANSDQKLKNHLESVKKNYPEIFQDKLQFASKLAFIFGASPFSSNPNVPSTSSSMTSSDSYSGQRQNSTSFRNSPYALSPSYNPALSNILHPSDIPVNQSPPVTVAQSTHIPYKPSMSMNSTVIDGLNRPNQQAQPYNNGGGSVITPGNSDALMDYLNDDNLSTIFFSQMNSLPNFFFDNNSGI
ncbi:fungal-specific transcription factor domain-containing protein [Scheffersomyces coipomensis]|uniref:fungal-specific transcription factor domain-containing protein n=1 Tax=Scheffersomyces coipomensis TaxID=1788519 RepID=UPI00315D7016